MARKNDIEMYSAHNDWKSVVAERFIRNIKNKIYKYINIKNIDKYQKRIQYQWLFNNDNLINIF